ncbi:MAG: hypothetical protein ACE5HT_04535 [Gemmatimonadales bacterium]
MSHGRTSDYLSPKVHRPVVQFSSVDSRSVRRYAALPSGVADLGELDEVALLRLLERARAH